MCQGMIPHAVANRPAICTRTMKDEYARGLLPFRSLRGIACHLARYVTWYTKGAAPPSFADEPQVLDSAKRDPLPDSRGAGRWLISGATLFSTFMRAPSTRQREEPDNGLINGPEGGQGSGADAAFGIPRRVAEGVWSPTRKRCERTMASAGTPHYGYGSVFTPLR